MTNNYAVNTLTNEKLKVETYKDLKYMKDDKYFIIFQFEVNNTSFEILKEANMIASIYKYNNKYYESYKTTIIDLEDKMKEQDKIKIRKISIYDLGVE